MLQGKLKPWDLQSASFWSLSVESAFLSGPQTWKQMEGLPRHFFKGILFKLALGWGSKSDLRGQGLQELGEGPNQQMKVAKLLRSRCSVMPRKQTPGHCSCIHVSRSLRPRGKETSFPWWPALDHSSFSNTTICCVLRKQKGKETLCLREKQLRQEVQLFNEVHPNEFHLMRPLDTGSNQATPSS